ncbi:MAG: DNA polymerase III subunit beta [Gammaproteobacteria bacterium]|nr:DNA polymerase III subunit beta [Gammaproteobacteria bacterium]
MKTITFKKNQWAGPLQALAGAVDKKQVMPILSTILVRFSDEALLLTATDLEIELTAKLEYPDSSGLPSFTIPAKKFLDLIRTLDDEEKFDIQLHEQHLLINAASTKFKLFTLPCDHFPLVQFDATALNLELPRLTLIHLLQSTAFSISQQDVRVFLNGMLLEFDINRITTVAADGHRMSIATLQHPHNIPFTRLILPRKSVSELLRLLSAIQDEHIQLYLHDRLFRVQTEAYVFSSKLIDSQFLPYHQAIPKQLQSFLLVEQDALKRALSRILIIANDKSRPVILEASPGKLTLLAQNQEQEQATEHMPATLDGEAIRIGINPYYLLEVLSVLQGSLIRLSFSTPDTSMLVESLEDEHYQYILMPMKI